MINWLNQRENAYPNIILCDSVIDELKIENRTVILELKGIGFAINCNGEFYRAKSSRVIFENCDTENMVIKRICRRKKMNGTIINVIDDIEINDLVSTISNQKCKFEIVEEYYSAVGGLFIGRIREKKYSEWCLVKMQFKSIVYQWDSIDHNHAVN